MTESLIATTDVDAFEERDMEVKNTPRAYLNADMDKKVFVKFGVWLEELLALTETEVYHKHMFMKNGKMIFYVQLWKALYECLSSTIFFCHLILVDIKGLWFELNLYDPFMSKKWWTVNTSP